MDTMEEITAQVAKVGHMQPPPDDTPTLGKPAQNPVEALPPSSKSVRLWGLPMPPSVNACYSNVPGRGRCKTLEYKNYTNLVHYWAMKNASTVRNAQHQLRGLQADEVIKMEYRFFCDRKKVINKKDGRPKKNDTANRLKPLDDQIAALVQIDDSLFWHGVFEKIPVVMKPLDREFVDVTLHIVKMG